MRDSIHLTGLNGLRALAAVAVVVSHINLNLDKFGVGKLPGLGVANFGVTLFFTLSGFLITFLLLQEHAVKGNIDIRKFYVRRILRIWPLYFLYMVVVITFHYAVGEGGINGSLVYYLLFIPNVAFAAGASIPSLTHYWSLGVEEQFYLLWPLVVSKFSKLNLTLISFILSFLLLKVLVKVLFGANDFYTFLHYSRFGCMAIGSWGGYQFFRNRDAFSWLLRPGFETAAWIGVVLVTVNQFHFYSIIDHELFAILVLILIVNQVRNPNPIYSLEKPIWDYLGKISFGLYVYNPLIIELVALVYRHFFGSGDDAARYFLIYVITSLAVVGAAHVSYHLFEKKFLVMKEKFSQIKTADSLLLAESDTEKANANLKG